MAADGKEGLECFLANQDRIGIVVTDQMMPEMTGLELLEHLQSEGATAVRVLSTAYADSAEVEAATSSGLVELFISKPWDLPELESILEQAESRWRARAISAA
jgi:CheY-like chemotaxis protein